MSSNAGIDVYMLRHTLEMLEIIFGFMPLFSIFFLLFLFWCIGPLQKEYVYEKLCVRQAYMLQIGERESEREYNVINMTRKQHHTDTNVRIE